MEIKDILSAFGIHAAEAIGQIYRSAWEVDGTYILKSSSDREQLEKSVLLSDLLRKEGVPVPEYVRTPGGKPFVLANDTHYVLMKKIGGRCLDPYEGNPHETGVLLGRLLARLHLALGKIEGQVASYDADYMRELDEWIMPRIRENHVRVSPKIVEYCHSFGPLYKTLPRQLIHRDTHLGNMLFMGETLAGWLDFDMSQKNARLHDLCYMGACMLVGNYRKRRRLRIWRELFRGVLHGYNEMRALTESELKAVPYMFVFIELTFTAFYAQHGDHGKTASCADMTAWLYRHRDKIASLAKL